MTQYSMKNEVQRNAQSLRAINLSVAANIFLAAIKPSVGILGHSRALLADGINSTSDVVYGLIVVIFIRQARKPADRQHPFGHHQRESIAALTVGAFVIAAAVCIFWDSVSAVYGQTTGAATVEEASPLAFWVAKSFKSCSSPILELLKILALSERTGVILKQMLNQTN